MRKLARVAWPEPTNTHAHTRRRSLVMPSRARPPTRTFIFISRGWQWLGVLVRASERLQASPLSPPPPPPNRIHF